MVTKRRGSAQRKQTSFRGAGVSPTFKDFSGDDFAQLVKDLLWSERFEAGLRPEELEAFDAGNKGDGGVDALLHRTPPAPTQHLRDGPCVFQFKRSSPSEAKWRSELQRPAQCRALDLLRAGASYTLVVGADIEREKIEAGLANAIKRLVPRWTGRAVVWNAEELKRWLCSNMATWGRVTRSAALLGLSPWEQWSREPRFDAAGLPWTPDERRAEALRVFAEEAHNPSGRRVWRFKGPPGIGKSRLVLEATRDLPGVHVAKRYSPELLGLDKVSSGWLVVDECDDDQHTDLVRLFERSKVRLVTIGRDTARSPHSDEVWLGALDDEACMKLLPSGLPVELRQLLVKQAGGYPKLLRLLRRAVQMRDADSPAAAGTWSEPELRKALEELLGGQLKADRRALKVWALPSIASESEVKTVALALGMQAIDVGEARQLLDEQGLLGQVTGGTEPLYYMTPQLLAEWLAWSLWDADVDSVLGAIRSGSPVLRHNCVRRVAMGGSELLAILRRIPAGALVEIIDGDPMGAVADVLASDAPDEAFDLVRRLLHARATSSERTSAVLVLKKLAWFESSFPKSVATLAEMDGAATGRTLVDLFGCFLGTTQAPGPTRLAALDELSRASSTEIRRLAVRCAREACDLEGARMTTGLPQPIEQAWRPTTPEEERSYKAGAVDVLCRLLSDEEVRADAFEACAKVIRPLFARGQLALLSRIVDAWRASGHPVAPLRKALDTIERFDRPRVQTERLEELRTFSEARRSLEPQDLGDRVQAFLETETSQRHGGEALAAELVSAPGAEDIVREVLVSATGHPGAHDLGRLCGRVDASHRLLPAIDSVASTARSIGFASGYCAELPLAVTDASLRGWAARSEAASFVFQMLQHLDVTPARSGLMLELVARGAIPPDDLRQLWYARWMVRQDAAFSSALLGLVRGSTRFLLAHQWAQGQPRPPDRSNLLLGAWYEMEVEGLDDDLVAHFWREEAPNAVAAGVLAALETALRLASEDARRASRWPEALAECFQLLRVRGPTDVVLGRILDALCADEHLASWLRARRFLGDLSDTETTAVLDWAREHPKAAAVAASLSSGIDRLAVGLVEAYPTDSALQRTLREAVFPIEVFMAGEESARLLGRQAELEVLARSSKTPASRRWFARLADEVGRRALQVQQAEDAFRRGALPVPFVASP